MVFCVCKNSGASPRASPVFLETGSGKTRIAAEVINRHAAAGGRGAGGAGAGAPGKSRDLPASGVGGSGGAARMCVFLAPTNPLVEQVRMLGSAGACARTHILRLLFSGACTAHAT